MKRRRVALGFAALAALLVAGPATAGGSRDLQDGWVVPPELLRALLSASASATGTWAAAGEARLYGLPELPVRAAAAGWRHGRWRVAASWQRLGADLLREDRARVELLVGARQALGFAAGWDLLRLGDGAPRRRAAASVEVRLLGPAGTRVSGSLPLTVAPPWYGRGGSRRWWSVARVGGDAAWCLAIDRDARGAPLVEAEGTLRVAAGCGVGLRWEPATGSLGLTTAWTWRGLLLRSSHLAHPALGLTHRWSVSLGGEERWP